MARRSRSNGGRLRSSDPERGENVGGAADRHTRARITNARVTHVGAGAKSTEKCSRTSKNSLTSNYSVLD